MIHFTDIFENVSLRTYTQFMKEMTLPGDKAQLQSAKAHFNYLVDKKLNTEAEINALKSKRIHLKKELVRIDNLINYIKFNNMAKNYLGSMWLSIMTETEQMNYRIARKSSYGEQWADKLANHYNSLTDFLLDSLSAEIEIPYWKHVDGKYKDQNPDNFFDKTLHADDNDYRERYDNLEE